MSEQVIESGPRTPPADPEQADTLSAWSSLITGFELTRKPTISLPLSSLDPTDYRYLRKALFKGPTAPCDLCGRVFEVEFLVAAHIKKRADCDDQEKRDVAHVVMSACRFGCDELYERGYIAVGDDGQLIFSDAIEASEHARAYAVQHLKGKSFGRPMTGRTDYFTWHRENKFLDAV